MKYYVNNLEEQSIKNENFREVLHTSENMQLVVMSLLPLEDIGLEVHHLDQFIRVEKGTGKAILNEEEFPLEDGSALIVPSGTNHNIINTSSTEKLKLYTLYAPPNHPDGKIHKTKAEAEQDEHEH